ncbi:hypothetical protein [Streptomyces sp. 891-h]|uniref:hypothetical protein n=1 Tax=Streptomyces sp. 891-h TaxID=2720714 RepID=UPI001FA9A026|nr:hypothetical protein [Streptomyces sp. 891-h]UNZ18170.1 hypothetical protein HC362_15075 [Streptomyces sp. 891-h]
MMLAIARVADEEGKSTMTLKEISQLTRLSQRSITECLTQLEALGELSHQRGGGRSKPNNYFILLGRNTEGTSNTRTEVPTFDPDLRPKQGEGGTSFSEDTPKKHPRTATSEKFLHAELEVSSSRTRVGDTPVGSITTQKQASSPQPDVETVKHSESVDVPSGAKELVSAVTGAGMLVGWRLTESEWERVTALSERWGPKRLVEMAARRWNTSRPPQSARYLLRIWDDLPAHCPPSAQTGNVVSLPRQPGPGAWAPFQNVAQSSAYQNGF